MSCNCTAKLGLARRAFSILGILDIFILSVLENHASLKQTVMRLSFILEIVLLM